MNFDPKIREPETRVTEPGRRFAIRPALQLSCVLAILLASTRVLAVPVVVSSNIIVDTTWSQDVVLTGPIFVAEGATLTILPGLVVRAEPVTAVGDLPGALVVTQDGQLIADGTAAQPIIFASAAVDNDGDGLPDDADADGYPDAFAPGDVFLDQDLRSSRPPDVLASSWWGVFLLGSAKATQGCVGLEQGNIKFLALTGNPASWSLFGGSIPGDSSGTLRHVELRSATPPSSVDPDACCDGILAANGFVLAGVGDGTIFESNDFDSSCWRGFADLHAHPMSHLAFGHRPANSICTKPEGLFHGEPGGALDLADRDLGVDQDLSVCSEDDHSFCPPANVEQGLTRQGMLGLLENHFPNHGPSGAPDFMSWPNARSRTHQQMHVKWLREAYEAGQRVMIASITDNQVLDSWYHYWQLGATCEVFTKDPTFARQAADEQIAALQALAAANPEWLYIADGPEDAVDAAFPLHGPGKLVLILGLEFDALSLADTLDLIDHSQIRSVIPIHLVNNSFGGAAVYDDLFNTLNKWHNGDYFQMVNDPSLSFHLGPAQRLNASHKLTGCAVEPKLEVKVDPTFAYTEQSCSGESEGGQRNTEGIADFDGLYELMRRGVLLDMSHMSWASKSDTLLYAEQISDRSGWGGYPVIDTHTGLRDEDAPPAYLPEVSERDLSRAHARRIQNLGGMIGFGTVGEPGTLRIFSGPGRDEEPSGYGRNNLARLTGESRELIVYPEPTDERAPDDLIEQLRVRVRTGADNLEAGSTARLLIEAFGSVYELPLKDPGVAWDNHSIHEVTIDQTVAAVPLASLGIKVLDVTKVGARLIGSDDWNIDRLDVLYVGLDGAGNPASDLLVERFGTPYVRLSGGGVAEILAPPVDWRPKLISKKDVMVDSLQFHWDTSKNGPLDPDVMLVISLHRETLAPGAPDKRQIMLTDLAGLSGDPDGGGPATGTWDLLADPVAPGPIRYGDIASISAFASGRNDELGYDIRVQKIDLRFTTSAGGSDVFIDGSDASAQGTEPFWLRDDRRSTLLWLGLPPPSDLARADLLTTPLLHLRLDIEVGDDNLEQAQDAFLDLDLHDGRQFSLQFAQGGVQRLDAGSTKSFDLHMPVYDVLIGDVIALRVRVPGLVGGLTGDNWDVQRIDLFRAGDPMKPWLQAYSEANWVMGGNPLFPPDPLHPPDPTDPSDPTRYEQGFVALGTDFNGLSPQMPYADPMDIGTPPPAEGTPITLPGPYSGTVGNGETTLGRTFQFEADGLAHYGMLKDFAGRIYERDPWAGESLYRTAPRILETWKQAARVGRSLTSFAAPTGTSGGVCGMPACSDGADNDGDGLIDYPLDPDCANALGVTEVPEPQVWIGLGAGALLLCLLEPRRRRRRASASSARIAT